MAFLKPKSNPDPAILVITPLADHPGHQHLVGVRRVLMAAVADRQRLITLAAYEAELRNPSSGSGRGPRATQNRETAEKLRKAIPAPAAPAPSKDGWPPAIAQAMAVAGGEKITPEPDSAARLKQARGDLAALEAGLREVTIRLDELRAEQTYEAAQKLLPNHRAALRRMFMAAQEMAEATQAEREIVVDLITAGYDAAEHILLRPGLSAASRLGTLNEHDSEISFFRRRLESMGVI